MIERSDVSPEQKDAADAYVTSLAPLENGDSDKPSAHANAMLAQSRLFLSMYLNRVTVSDIISAIDHHAETCSHQHPEVTTTTTEMNLNGKRLPCINLWGLKITGYRPMDVVRLVIAFAVIWIFLVQIGIVSDMRSEIKNKVMQKAMP